MAAYARNPNVLFAELNGIFYAIGAPNDSRSREQWQFNNSGQTGGTIDADMDAFEAWDVTTGSSSVAIAILDTGINEAHEDLGGAKVVKSINFSDSTTTDDVHGHGTHVAGSAAAATNNGVGVAAPARTASSITSKCSTTPVVRVCRGWPKASPGRPTTAPK